MNAGESFDAPTFTRRPPPFGAFPLSSLSVNLLYMAPYATLKVFNLYYQHEKTYNRHTALADEGAQVNAVGHLLIERLNLTTEELPCPFPITMANQTNQPVTRVLRSFPFCMAA